MSKKKVASSPQRYTFQRDRYIERKKEEGLAEDDGTVANMIEYYNNWLRDAQQQIDDPEWQVDNLEYDLRSTDWVCDKVKNSKAYAQSLYAALCNNYFVNSDMFNILKENYWSCSWRYAGGIIADMREEGDYIDWYCSGITDDFSRVGEGTVTDEIREDLKKLGWFVVDEETNKKQ